MVNNVKDPKISVLMPVYNCELYIQEAIDSILNQTLSDFELLIIDDASIDKTVSIIKAYNDCRIRLIQKPLNAGLTDSLNQGLKLAKGKYIARMDGDDISLPTRFEKQVVFLEANPDVVLCGTNFKVIGTEKVVVLPQKNEMIKLRMLKGNCLAHPSVMIRKQILDKFSFVYDVKKEPAEDFDLWVRLIAIGQFHNLQEVLLNYRVHDMQVSKKREKQQSQLSLQLRLEVFKYLNYSFGKEEYNLLKKIIEPNLLITLDEIKDFFVLTEKMVLANSNSFFDPTGFQEYLLELRNENLMKYFVGRERYYPINFYQYLLFRNKYNFKLTQIDEIKLMIKSIICYKIEK